MSRAGPNRTSAVMQSRREPHDSLDDFPTPPWGTRALLERLEWIAPCRRRLERPGDYDTPE